jgi:tetratricopeptide (TPR) repeat protein
VSEEDFLDNLLEKMEDEEKDDKKPQPAQAPTPMAQPAKTVPAQKPPEPVSTPRPAAAPPPRPQAAQPPRPIPAKKEPAPEAREEMDDTVPESVAGTKVLGTAETPADDIKPAPDASRIDNTENWINYLIMASSVVLLLLFVQYVIYEKIWLDNFAVFNMFPLVVLSIVVALAFLIMLSPGMKQSGSALRSAAIYGGMIITAMSPVLVLIQNTRTMGVGIGFIGLFGILVMLIARAELRAKDALLLVLFMMGTVFVVLTKVLTAFGMMDVPATLGLLFESSGLVLILVGTVLMGKMMKNNGKLIGYFGIWTVGIVTIALVPFHEAAGLNSSRNYGPFDQSLIFGGLLCLAASLFLAVYRRYDVAKTSSLIVKGNMLQENGKLKESLEYYDRAQESGVNNEIVLTNRGSLLRKMRKYDDALECFAMALEINPYYEEALIGRGNVLTRVGSFDAALQCYDAVLSESPNHLDALVNRGVLLALMDRDDEADRSISKAVTLAPRSEFVWLGKAFIERKRGSYTEEKRSYDKTLEINSSNIDAWLGRGNVLAVLERYEDARDSFNRALELDPDNSDALTNLAALLLKQEKYDESLGLYRKANEIDGDSVIAQSGMGFALFKTGNAEEGMKYLDRALAQSPNSIDALVFKGDVMQETGRYVDAVRLYKSALEINPNLRSVIKSLADSLKESGNGTEAEAYYHRLDEIEKKKVPVMESVMPVMDIRKMMADVKSEPVAKPVLEAAPALLKPSIPVKAGTKPAPLPEPKPSPEVQETKVIKIERGFNYLIYEERTRKTYELVARMLEEGVKVLCITPTFPAKLKKEYGLATADIVWISESNEKDAINPKRLEFEIARAIGNFIRGNVDPVLVIDGFELLMLQNGYENVMKFIKKANDLASVNSATIVVPLNPGALKKEDLPLLTKEFDKVEDLINI